MKRRIAGLLIFVLAFAGIVGCSAAVEPEGQDTATSVVVTATIAVAPSETATVAVSPTVVETPEVEETPTIEETSDFGDRESHEKSDVTGTPELTREGEPTMTPSGVEMSEDLPQVDMAKADLAQRLDVGPEAIEVVLVEARVWPDASMGCPQPGMVYTQVPQDGLLIRLQVEGQIYDYHSGGTRDPFLCEQEWKGTQGFGEEIVPPPSLDE